MPKLATTISWATLAAALAATPALAQDAAKTVGELVVTGQRASQEKAIKAKKDSTAVLDAISADDIGRLADKNVAENVERLPGVGVVYDQGEGRYVAIRGMDAQFNNLTLNGVEIGNPDGNDARVPLDVVSGQILGRIEVIKVVTPEMDAQGLGGTVNLVTQSPFDSGRDLFGHASAQVGYQEANHSKNPYQGDASIGGIFGGGTWGALLGVNGSTRTFRSDGLFPDDWRTVPGVARGGLPTNLKYTNYEIKRERVGVSGALEYRPTDTDKFYLRGLYSKFTEDEHRQRFRLDFASNLDNVTINPDGVTGVSTKVDARQDLRVEHKEKAISSVSVGGEHERGPWRFDYDLSYGYTEVNEPNRLWQFRAVSANATVDWNVAPLLYTAEPRASLLSNLGFRQYQEQDEHGQETNWAGRINVRRDVDWGDGGYVKFGAKLRAEDKKFDGRTDQWDRGSSANRFTLADFDLHGADQQVAFDGRTYVNRYVIDEAAIIAFTDQNLSGARFVKNVATSLSNNTLNDYGLNQDIYAGYGMADIRFGQLRVIGGLRVERTEVDIDGYRLVNGTTVTPVSRSNGYTDILPNLQLRFEPQSDLVFRAAYSRTLGRPSFTQLKLSGSLTFVDNNDGTFDGSLSEGNVDLKPYVSDNLDATAEWYFARGGLLSAGAFYKHIKDPIYGFSEVLHDVTIDGRTYATLDYSQPRNADSGHITGLELAYQQQFLFLPGLWSGFGVAANVTFTDSSVTVPGRGKADFQSQSDLLYGVQLFYQKGPFEAALSYHVTGKNLLSLGSTPEEDVYSDDYKRLDAKASYAINERVEVFVELQNLTDEILRQYQSDHRDWITDYERLRQTYYIGVTAKW